MERTLKQSLAILFGEAVEGEGTEKVAVTKVPGEAADLPRRALELYNRSLELLREGNWSGFGEEQKRLEEVLKGMQNP